MSKEFSCTQCKKKVITEREDTTHTTYSSGLCEDCSPRVEVEPEPEVEKEPAVEQEPEPVPTPKLEPKAKKVVRKKTRK